ncbi:MAG: hypothetical protein U1D55_08660 [Phycisphaerae bacterium]
MRPTHVAHLGYVLLTAMAAGLPGCADWDYDRIRLGQKPEEYERILPAGDTRRTDLGQCYFKKDSLGRADVIAILVSQDRRLAAKLHATTFERRMGLTTRTGYRVLGELDPRVARLEAAGPVDALRAIVSDLLTTQADAGTRDAHALIASGLMRVLERWGGAQSVGMTEKDAAGVREKSPPGGEANLTVDPSGAYRYSYEQGWTR